MRRVLLTIFAVISSSTVLAQDSWSTFRDPEAIFSVDVPGTPTVTASTTKGDDGADIKMVTYMVDRQTLAMAVIVGDFSGRNLDPGKAIDAAVNGLQRKNGPLSANNIDQVDGQVGRSVSMIDADGDAITDRIFFVNAKLYQALAVTSKDATQEEKLDAQRFSASLHFTPR